MVNSRHLLLLLFSMLIVVGQSQAYSRANVNALLSSYNVSTSLINSLTAANISYSGREYVALYSSSKMDFLVNITNSSRYTFVLNSTSIYNIIRNTSISTSLGSVNFTLLKDQMEHYNQSSAPVMNDCLYETGLTNGQTCTLANGCEACLTVPLCKCALTALGCPKGMTAPGGGPTGTFGLSVMQFESEETNLSDSYNSFVSAANSINASNANANIAVLVSSFSVVSSVTQSIGMNPLFPPPQNADFNLCASAGTTNGNFTTTSGPWYCNALGFCGFLTYNNTLLGSIQATISNLKLLPISNAQILQIATNVSASENTYITPILSARQTKQYSIILNTTLKGYGALSNNSAVLLTHISNASLSASLSTMKSNYSKLQSQYLSLNLTKFNATLAIDINALRSDYSAANATYSSIIGLAKNNTALLIELQLNSNVSAESINSLSFREAQINGELSGQISNISQVRASLLAINSQAKSESLYSGSDPLAEFTRSVDKPVVTLFDSGLSGPYASKVSLVPLIAALIAFIIGLVILAIVYLQYRKLHHRHKIHVNSRTSRNWKILFAVAVILVALFVILSYFFAAAANGATSTGAFRSAVMGAKTIAVMTNGTTTPQELSCAQQIKTTIKSNGKSVISASIEGNQCTVNGTVFSLDDCLNSNAANGVPMVILTNSNRSSISAYSFYGTILRVNGNSTFMSTCIASALVS